MASSLTLDAFLDVIQRSRLVRADELQTVLKELESAGADLDSPKAVAAALLDRNLLTRWQADYLLQGKHRGFFIGPYRFLKLLGKGGMGAVYLAQHEMMRRRCAIKVLPAKLLKDKTSVLERFYREAQAVAALDHPNIVRAYDVNREMQGGNEIHYLVMEYVEGKDLQSTVVERGQGLEYVEVADFARQAACGLAHAHENGLIHRDIKPANLLVDTKGVVKILDLGLARFHDDRVEASLTAAYNESILGTADYLSPEQALNSHEVDTRTDIYSLGCTCYYMLTGQPPFPDGSVAQRLIAHQVKSPAPISKARPDVPSDLVAIIDKMIAKKPEGRYQTANEAAEALRLWLVTHADEGWKQQHRDVVGDGSGPFLVSALEPTRAKSASAEDTEVELGLAPVDEYAPTTASGSGASLLSGSSSDLRKGPQPVKEAAAQLEPLAGDSASSIRPSATPEVPAFEPGPFGSPLDDLFAQPLQPVQQPQSLADFSTGALPTVSGSGILTARPGVAARAVPSENRQLLWLILIGLGVSVPLAVVILFVSLFMYAPKPGVVVDATRTSDAPPGAAESAASSQVPAEGKAEPAGQPSKAAATTKNAEPAKVDASSAQGRPPEGDVSPVPLAGGSTPKPAGPAAPTAMSAPPPGAAGAQTPSQPPAAAGPPTAPGGTSIAPPPQQPGAKAAGEATPPPQPTAPSPPPAGGQAGAPAKPAGSPEPKAKTGRGAKGKDGDVELSPDERSLLFASVSDVTVVLDRDAKSKVDMLLARSAVETLQKEGLKAVVGTKADAKTDAKAVLALSMSVEKDDPYAIVMLTGELKCPVDGSGKASVWKQTAQIARLAPQFLKKDAIPPTLRENVDKFFSSFARDHHAAIAAARVR